MIEVAKPEDAARIAHVRHETWLATYPNAEAGVTREDIFAKDFQSEDQIDRWRRGIESTKGTRKIWVARNEAGEVVGYGQGLKRETENEIGGMYVLPAYQGKGLGNKLMGAVIDWLGNDKPIALSVAVYSLQARELYKKFGFIDVDEPGAGPIFASGATATSIKMVRPKQ
ncbi:GNAT family N-acetyltransferase [Patescibacteria group bacterium]|nr:GNAT family N-acetyltransferase [Patescibacteria group bacterium]